MPLQGGVFLCLASFHAGCVQPSRGISLGLPTDVICLAQSTQRTQRYLVDCRASMNGCRCEMAYGYRAEDAEGTEMSCWLSCADKWLSHFRRTYRRSLLRLSFNFILHTSCFILPTSLTVLAFAHGGIEAGQPLGAELGAGIAGGQPRQIGGQHRPYNPPCTICPRTPTHP